MTSTGQGYVTQLEWHHGGAHGNNPEFCSGDKFLVMVWVRNSSKSDKFYPEYSVIVADCDEHYLNWNTPDGERWGWDWSDVEWFARLDAIKLPE